jgi:hypothetical protein
VRDDVDILATLQLPLESLRRSESEDALVALADYVKQQINPWLAYEKNWRIWRKQPNESTAQHA